MVLSLAVARWRRKRQYITLARVRTVHALCKDIPRAASELAVEKNSHVQVHRRACRIRAVDLAPLGAFGFSNCSLLDEIARRILAWSKFAGAYAQLLFQIFSAY